MEFTAMLQKDLMILARERSIKGRSKMRKADLVKALHQDELERREGRGVGKEEKKRAKSERKAELKETRKERKGEARRERERKEMRTKSEIKESKRERRDLRPSEAPVQRKSKKNKRKQGSRKGHAAGSRSYQQYDTPLGLRLVARPRPKARPRAHSVTFTPEVIQTRSALKGFARQYVYEGLDGVGPREFLEMHEGAISDILDTNPRTKVRIILKCMMEKRDLKTGEVVEKEAVFHSRVEVNLEADDMAAFLQRAFDKIMEDMATYISWIQKPNSKYQKHYVQVFLV